MKLMDGFDSNYRYILVAARRARQLQGGAPPVIETPSRKPCRIAQDEIRAGKTRVDPLAFQNGHGLYAIGSHLQMNRFVGSAKGFLSEPDVARTIFHQQNFYRDRACSHRFHHFPSLSGRLK